ncbi:MAG: hypothetical protein A2848_02985 [Candidatus Magasanikbacteria bacterium RIFCSPHIGHO2_01_FULL_50_8]|uniref:Uncharacterized protein n=1 Tax=Candidatus Magasanikbacteria bacterium RIFCSPHIGHO2_01_FULL_50_8 TaxID=1798674 RepID=A0A1F6LRX8_9BACT|nr:MAG: hypothetical protein A2848_02985 [Candidatus Magasanikbacteria bacterium RIFCSPHIGHO2_01_FULL_50_8]
MSGHTRCIVTNVWVKSKFCRGCATEPLLCMVVICITLYYKSQGSKKERHERPLFFKRTNLI